jgi:hypothetical protein
MHRTTRRFWQCFNALSKSAQERATKNFDLLKKDPTHPSLHFKPLGKFWSVRAGIHYRALAIKDGADFIWVWIGLHNEYERPIK